MSSPADKNLLSVKKTSSLLEVSPDTLRRLDNKGQVVPTRGPNGERLYSANDISLLKQVLKKPLSERSYGIQETANILRVSPQTIRRWEREGKISTTRTPGGQRLFTLKDIQALQNLPKKVQVFPPPQAHQITQAPQTPEMPVAPKTYVSESVSPILPFPIPQSVSTEPEVPAQVVFAKKQRKNFSPYIVLVLLLLLLGGTVAYIGSQTFFKSNASKDIEVADTTPESPIQQVANIVSNVFKKGSVMFQGQNDQLAEDNQNLFWDITNAFLGIGTNMPNSRLTVSGGVSGTSLVSLVSQEVGNILTATNNGQTVFNVDSSGNTQVAGALSDINDSSLNVLQNLAVGGDVNVAGGDVTSSKDLRVYSSTSTTLGASSSPTTISGKDIYFKNGVLINSIKLSNTATALPNGNTGIVDAIVDAWNHGGSSSSDEWSNASNVVYPNNLTDNLAVGGTTSVAPFYITASTGDTKVGDLTVTGGNIQMTGVNCTTYTNGGVLTTDALGNVICGNDDSGMGGITSFSDIASGTNITAAMVVGTGASLNYSGTGTINSSSLEGKTWEAPGTIGSGTPNTGAFTTLSANSSINTGAGAGTARIDASGNLTAIGTTQINGVTYTWPASISSNNYVLQTQTDGTLAWVDPAAAIASNIYWTSADGALFPKNNSLDVLIGADSTSSARFAFTGVNAGGTPTASIAGTTTGIATYLTGDGNLATTNMQPLTLGGATTSIVNVSNDLNLASSKAYFINGSSVLNANTLGTDVVTSSLTTTGTLASGSIANGFGTITTGNTITGTTINGTTGINTGAVGGTQRIDATGNLVNIVDIGASGYATISGSLALGNTTAVAGPGNLNASGIITGVSMYQGANQVCDTSGNCSAATDIWSIANGALYPKNSSVDVLFGGTATSSAKFAFMNVATGTPTASISGAANVATYIDGNGNISTTNRADLVLGNSATYDTTGNILFNPNGTGNVGIGTTTPNAPLNIVSDSSDSVFLIEKTDGFGLFRVVGQSGYTEAGGDLVSGGYGYWMKNFSAPQRFYLGHTTTTDPSIVVNSSGAVSFHSYGTQPLALNAESGGNVGIGTTSPTQRLDVLGNINDFGSATISASFAAGIPLTVKGATSQTGDLTEWQNVSGAVLAKVDALGNLSTTGYATVSGSLAVGNTTALAGPGNINASGRITGVSIYQGANQVCDVSGNCNAVGNYWQLTANSLSPVNSTYALNIGNTASTSAFFHVPGTNNQDAWFNLGTGNVGIGTTSPSSLLYVNGTLPSSGTVNPTNFRVVNSGMTATAGNDYPLGGFTTSLANTISLNVRAHQNNTTTGWAGQALGLSFDVDSTVGAGGQLWFNSGNVGIGTTGPGYPLEINKSGTTAYQSLAGIFQPAQADGNTNSINFGRESSAGKGGLLGFTLGTAGASYADSYISLMNYGDTWGTGSLNIKKGGNVGIGTTSPVSPLQVKGAVYVTSGVSNPYPPSGKGISMYFSDINDSGNILSYDRDASTFKTMSFGASQYLFGNGNVGIGMTPSYKLDITGGSATDGVHIYHNGGQYVFDTANAQVYMGNFGDYTGTTYGFSKPGTVQLAVTYSTGYVSMPGGHGADIAENYQITGTILRGGLVSVDNTNAKTAIAASSPTQPVLIGVITTTPGAVMDADGGFNVGYATKSTYVNEKAPIALVGSVPTLVTSQNGPINNGDAIGISTIPGFGAKMTTAGNIVGKAMEKLDTVSCPTASSVDSMVWPEDDGKNSLKPCFLLPDGTYVGKIMVAIAPSWYDPDVYLTDTGDLNIQKKTDGTYQIAKADGTMVNKIGAFAKMVAANVKAGTVVAQEIATNSFTAFQGTVDNLLVKSGLVAVNIQTKLISPLADSTDVTIQIGSEATPSGQFVVQNTNGDAVAAIDNMGNATFAGTINSQQLTVNSASVSGTLYADNIKSQNLDDIQALLAKVETDQNILKNVVDWSTLTATNSANLDQIAVADLYVTNQGAFNSLSVTNTVTIGSDLVMQSSQDPIYNILNTSIDTLSAPLKIQSLAMAPIEIMAGLVTIDTHGNVNIAGNLYVAGRINSSGLTLRDNQQSASDSASLLSLQNNQGAVVASVDASGSAIFTNIQTQRITGSNEDRGSVEILPAEDTKMVLREWTSTPSAVLVSTSYKTQAWVTDTSDKGFTIRVSDSPLDTTGKVFWWALW